MPTIKSLSELNQNLQASGKYRVVPPTVPESPNEHVAFNPNDRPLPGVTVTGLPIRGVFNPTQILDTDFTNTTTGTRTSPNLRSPTFPPQQTANIQPPAVKFNAETAIAVAQKAGNAAALQVFSGLNMDTIPEGVNFGKPKQTALTPLGAVNPALPGFTTQGSVPVAGANGFTYTSTTTSITWTPPPLVYRADGTTTAIPSTPIVVTGLVANTMYDFYPFWSEANSTLSWVSDATATGSPAYAFTGETSTSILQHSQAQNLQGNIPLSGGPLMAATPSSGTGGGGGGGTRYCVREDMLVETRYHIVKAHEIFIGDELACPDIGFTTVTSVQILEQHVWIKIETQHSGILVVTPNHHITLADGSGKAAEDLGLHDIIQVRYGADSIKSLVVLHETSRKVKLHCEPEHRFYAGLTEPSIVAHNQWPVS